MSAEDDKEIEEAQETLSPSVEGFGATGANSELVFGWGCSGVVVDALISVAVSEITAFSCVLGGSLSASTCTFRMTFSSVTSLVFGEFISLET